MPTRTTMEARAYIHLRLLALTAAAGCVDAACYLGLEQVFTANQTGNTVLLGIAVGEGSGHAVLRSSLSLGGFVAGVLIAAVALRGTPKAGGRAWPPCSPWRRPCSRS